MWKQIATMSFARQSETKEGLQQHPSRRSPVVVNGECYPLYYHYQVPKWTYYSHS